MVLTSEKNIKKGISEYSLTQFIINQAREQAVYENVKDLIDEWVPLRDNVFLEKGENFVVNLNITLVRKKKENFDNPIKYLNILFYKKNDENDEDYQGIFLQSIPLAIFQSDRIENRNMISIKSEIFTIDIQKYPAIGIIDDDRYLSLKLFFSTEEIGTFEQIAQYFFDSTFLILDTKIPILTE